MINLFTLPNQNMKQFQPRMLMFQFIRRNIFSQFVYPKAVEGESWLIPIKTVKRAMPHQVGCTLRLSDYLTRGFISFCESISEPVFQDRGVP